MTPRPLPARRFVVLAKAPGQAPQRVTDLLTLEQAEEKLALLFGSPRVRTLQYALAELQLVETYR